MLCKYVRVWLDAELNNITYKKAWTGGYSTQQRLQVLDSSFLHINYQLQRQYSFQIVLWVYHIMYLTKDS